MKKTQYIVSLGIVNTILLVGCREKEVTSYKAKLDEAVPVKVITLNKTGVSGNIYTSGQFTTDDETMLSFKTTGVISKIYVKEGNRVRKGQLLATLDLTEISAQVNQAQITLEKARRDFNRTENLYKDSVISLEQFQNAKTGQELAQQQMAAASFNLSYSEIRANHDGMILKKLANEGQIINSGTPVLQTSSKGRTDWILRVAVSDKEWAETSLRDKAKVEIEALNLKVAEGYVYAKSENTDQLTGTFSIDIKLNNTQKLNIASGMFGKANISVSRKDSVWRIPYDALLDGNASSGFVFVTNNNKEAAKVLVKIIAIEKNEVLISDGLSGYNALIVSGSAYLTDKSAIKVVNN